MATFWATSKTILLLNTAVDTYWATFGGNSATFYLTSGHTGPDSYCQIKITTLQPVNTHLLCEGKYHCTDDLLFEWFRFSCLVWIRCTFGWIQTSQTGGQVNYTSKKWIKSVQWYFPLRSKWVFSAATINPCIYNFACNRIAYKMSLRSSSLYAVGTFRSKIDWIVLPDSVTRC